MGGKFRIETDAGDYDGAWERYRIDYVKGEVTLDFTEVEMADKEPKSATLAMYIWKFMERYDIPLDVKVDIYCEIRDRN